jgi:hypothetical protein
VFRGINLDLFSRLRLYGALHLLLHTSSWSGAEAQNQLSPPQSSSLIL